ncbi:MAG TPA: tetratricopeptide repeat protein [Isosphaeraceae bacterium]|jgi:serine/threonine-protein kinase|nr:tetratricopeptide repeat protein [Isosphaeraceae bacterium]
MDVDRICRSCGTDLAGESVGGLCPACLLRAGLGPDGTGDPRATADFVAAGPGSLATLASSLGGLPRVLLRDTDPESGPSPLERPDSPGRPTATEAGRYQLFGEIARGGMGAILKARDPDLGRELAVKVLLERHRDNPDFLRRFVEEAQIGGQLQHPGIVPIYELGAFADRRPFFTMKLVKGRTLAELLRERSSPADGLPRSLGIFEQVCQTVAYAHARGVIHRDLKPSNIMVGGFGEVQVMDWGLAKVLPRGGATDDGREPTPEPDPPASVVRTSRSGSDAGDSMAGSVLGTPGYMAPEQARGEVEAVDERADVFGLGAILCEVLTGGPAVVGGSPGETLRKTCRGDLDDAFGRLDACGAEAELVELARDCLAPEPEGRPRRAGAVAGRMAAYLAGVQDRLRRAELARVEAQARAEEEGKRAKVERDRRRLAVGLAAAVLALAAVVGVSAGAYQRRRAANAEAVARVLGAARTLRNQALERPDDPTRWQVALAAIEQAEGALGGVAEARRELQALRVEVEAGADAARRDRTLLDRLADIRSTRSEDNQGTAADASYAVAFRDAGLDPDALPTAEAVALVKARPPALATAVVAALDDWAAIRRDRGRAGDDWHRLVAVARGVDPDPGRDRLRALFSKGDVSAGLGPLRALAREVDPGSWPVQTLDLLANTLAHAGDPEAAADLLGRARLRHPGDFWINHDLATMIRRARPTATAEAIQAYSIARALRPRSAHDLGHLLEQSGRTAEAVAVFDDLAHRAPDDPRHLVCLGKVREGRGEADAAREAYRRAAEVARGLLKARPDDLQAYLVLGNALQSLGDQDGAVAAYRGGLRLDPNVPVLHDNLGIALSKRGDPDAALAEHREALRLDPKYARAYSNMSTVLTARGELDGALDAAREAVRLEPDDPTPRTNLGVVLEMKGDHAGAVAAFREAVRLDPDLAEAHTDLGIALEGTGDLAAAVAEHRLAMRLKPSDPRPPNNLSAVLGRVGDLDGAIAAAREAVRRDPKYARGYKNLGVALENKGDLDGAIQADREAIRLRPDDPEAHFNLANALDARGDLDGAVAAGREAIRLAPARPGLRRNLGLILSKKGDLDGAIAAFREELQIRPDSAEALRSLGQVELRAGRPDEAIAAYRSLVRWAPRQADAHYDLAGALLISGRADEAITSYREALRLRPEYPEALCNLGRALLGQGSYAEALECFRRGHELGSKRPGWPYPSGDWVREAERLNDLDRRLPAVLRGEDVPVAADDWLDLARICAARGRHAAAVRLWDRAFAADPKRADDREQAHRYNAACSAALAAAGRSKDEPPPDATARARLRDQALAWLKAELTAWSTALDAAPPRARDVVRQVLRHWQDDADLAGIRDDADLATLPEADRAACKRLWDDVAALLARAGGR